MIEKIYELWMKVMVLATLKVCRKELGTKHGVRFMDDKDRPAYVPSSAIAYTSVDDCDITVMFWLGAIKRLIKKTIKERQDVSFVAALIGIARHEARHVWQFSYCYGNTVVDGYKAYDNQAREADANLYAMGYRISKEAYEVCCEDPIGNLMVSKLANISR